MMFSDASIADALAAGDVQITPTVDPSHVRPVGIRLHLDENILVPDPSEEVLDLSGAAPVDYRQVRLTDNGFVLQPRQFVLGSTVEAIQVRPDLVCHLDGRSTLARLGLMVHCTAGVIDNNNDEPRTIVLELFNFNVRPLLLKPGLPIAMLTISQLSVPIRQANATQYAGQRGVVSPDLAFHADGRHLREGMNLPRGT